MHLGINLLSVRKDRPVGVDAFVRDVVGELRLAPGTRTSLAIRNGNVEADILGPTFVERNGPLAIHRLQVGGTARRVLIEMLVLSRLFGSCDAVLSVNNFGPLFGKRGQRRIVVLHDVWFLSDRYQGASLTRALFGMLLRLQIRYTQDIVTVSEYSKREIVETLAVEDDRIHVVPNCIGRGLKEFSDGDNGNASGPGGVKRPYFLLIGSDRANKNVSRALAAYRRYAAGRFDVPALFLVGTYSANFVRRESAGLEADREPVLAFKGYVSRSDYIRLLKGAHAVVYPTIYEGFGIPVIEALAAGKRILISKGTVCEELAGIAGIAVDGESVEALANGFALLEEHAARGVPRGAARVPDCESSARLLAEVLQAGA